MLSTLPDPVFRPVVNRGEVRLAAEVVLAESRGHKLPECLHLRAIATLQAIATS